MFRRAFSLLNLVFDDKRIMVACIMSWLMCCVLGFGYMGIFSSDYMKIGPQPTLNYLTMKLDTMEKYVVVVVFVIISTAINDLASDSLGPFLQNSVCDHKERTIMYRKFTIICISQLWSVYCSLMGVASIALAFSQVDLIFIRLAVDLVVNQYTMNRFLRNKTYDPVSYKRKYYDEDEDASVAGVGLCEGEGASERPETMESSRADMIAVPIPDAVRVESRHEKSLGGKGNINGTAMMEQETSGNAHA
jgi:hypothetical protein